MIDLGQIKTESMLNLLKNVFTENIQFRMKLIQNLVEIPIFLDCLKNNPTFKNESTALEAETIVVIMHNIFSC